MKDAIGNFAAAICWGTLAGGAPFLLLTVPVAVVEMIKIDLLWALYMAVLPLAISGALTLGAMTCFGLPLTVLLNVLEQERREWFVAAGMAVGFVLPLVLFVGLPARPADFDPALLIIAIPGTIAGGVCAYRWGVWREDVARAEHEANEQALRPRRHPEKWSH